MKNGETVLNAGSDYQHPVIPKGFLHIVGTWDTGFVIQNESDKSEFVWLPVGWLDPDGTLDGEHFVEKLGRRKFLISDFSENSYHEEVNEAFVASVRRYGGFYISRFHAHNGVGGKAVFRKNVEPWININYSKAEKAAAEYAKDSKDVVSCITSGAAFDSMIAWIVKAGAKTREEVLYKKDYNKEHRMYSTTIRQTGYNECWCVLNICDVAGNVSEWTSEQRHLKHVIRSGPLGPVVHRGVCTSNYHHTSGGYGDVGFRAVLFLK